MRLLLASIACFMLTFINACTPIKEVSGYVPLEVQLQKLIVGKSLKRDVIEIIGEPLVRTKSQNNSLIYIQQEFETNSFFRREIKRRLVVELVFDNNSVLSEIRHLDQDSANSFVHDKTTVVAQGRKLSFWEQMFGNIGNFSSERFLN